MARSTNKSASSARSEITSGNAPLNVPTTLKAMEKFLIAKGNYSDVGDLKGDHGEQNFEMRVNGMGRISYKDFLADRVYRIVYNERSEANEKAKLATPEGKRLNEAYEKAVAKSKELNENRNLKYDALYTKIKEYTNSDKKPYEAFRDFVRGEKNMEEGDAKVAKLFPKEYAEVTKANAEFEANNKERNELADKRRDYINK